MPYQGENMSHRNFLHPQDSCSLFPQCSPSGYKSCRWVMKGTKLAKHHFSAYFGLSTAVRVQGRKWTKCQDKLYMGNSKGVRNSFEHCILQLWGDTLVKKLISIELIPYFIGLGWKKTRYHSSDNVMFAKDIKESMFLTLDCCNPYPFLHKHGPI